MSKIRFKRCNQDACRTLTGNASGLCDKHQSAAEPVMQARRVVVRPQAKREWERRTQIDAQRQRLIDLGLEAGAIW